MKTQTFALLGRAGLGNELFPLLRSLDRAVLSGYEMLPPRWLQVRVGPWLRGERDTRQYSRIFAGASPSKRLRALWIELCATCGDRVPLLGSCLNNVHIESGMDGYFGQLKQEGPVYEKYLRSIARPHQISSRIPLPYFSFHIRLGDFARPDPDSGILSANNTATPVSWYLTQAKRLRKAHPDVLIYISSDGSDEELAEILALPNVQRTSAKNALDEILILANACGLVGSRSTFSAWGAFLGTVPMFVIAGGNAYQPHDQVWEDDDADKFDLWLSAARMRSSDNVRPASS